MLKFVSAGVWGLQAIMAIVVLALSLELTKEITGNANGVDFKIPDPPTTTKYSAFCGGFGLAVAIFGAVATFFDAIPALVVMAVDAVSGVLLLAGGIAFAIGLRGITCDPGNDDDLKMLYANDIINRGKVENSNKKNNEEWPWTTVGTEGELIGNCKKATADQAMQFVTCGFALATIALVFLVWKKNRSGGGRAYV
ncbi:hypothetical protein CGCA056_v001224 [Colletotrichum aenigma]|uniref:uncharacterized protein n=1 Tax=Colletotrichum aenigma TaxID=1215731 RepID=UPI001872D37E|nr:uncharacterized protein CGCA056_v001224 [Colletotrichum aenigma]KAF5527427.1 hypothetical protein CGCA056_v001224 [Colletotrichum aenigma]